MCPVSMSVDDKRNVFGTGESGAAVKGSDIPRYKPVDRNPTKLEDARDSRRKVLLGVLVLHRIEHDPEISARIKA